MLRARTKVFIKPDEKVEKVGHILLSTDAQKTVERGVVAYSNVEDLHKGSVVYYDKALTIPFEYGDEKLLVVDESDVWAVEEKD